MLADIQKKWLEFYLEKLKLLKDKNIYKFVDLSKVRKVIKNCWIFNIKSNGCYKFVAKRFFQVEGINFDDLFSLFVYYETVHLFLAVATLKDWDIHSVNVKTAYLYSNLDKKIYMEQPEGFRLPSKKKKVW